MKVNFLYIIILLLIIATTSNVEGLSKKANNSITGQVITGDATVQYASVSVQIVALLPNTTLISPRNVTYFAKQNILLNYTSINEMANWYSINGGTNITITAPILFNISSNGLYILRLYANDTDNNLVIKNITFIANETRFNVSYDEFKNEQLTTSFDSYGLEEIQNLTNITINKNTIGKISFQETINLAQCSNNLCDLSSHINISFNRIELNSSALSNFNKSAILTLYNLTFSNPRILKDGSLCSSSECARISYSSGTLTFNVSSFSTYSAEETSSSDSGSGSSGSSSSSSGGSGSSSGGIVLNTPFTIAPNNFAVNLKRGDSKTAELIITNSNRSDISLELSSNLEELISIEEKSINLSKGESRIIKIIFKTNENLKESYYMGHILLKSRIMNLNIPISITLNSKNSLFDLKINIKESEVISGTKLISNLQLYNLGQNKNNVLVKYSIKDANNNLILSENVSIIVNKKAEIEKKFLIPEDLESGNYLISATIEYNDEIASTSAWFRVKDSGEELLDKSINLTIAIIIMILIYLLIFRIKNNKSASKNYTKK